MNYEPYTVALENLLKELRNYHGCDARLHPFWTYPILDARNIRLGYKLERQLFNPGILSLTVDPFTGFSQAQSGEMIVSAEAREKIIAAIKAFSANESETHAVVEV